MHGRDCPPPPPHHGGFHTHPPPHPHHMPPHMMMHCHQMMQHQHQYGPQCAATGAFPVDPRCCCYQSSADYNNQAPADNQTPFNPMMNNSYMQRPCDPREYMASMYGVGPFARDNYEMKFHGKMFGGPRGGFRGGYGRHGGFPGHFPGAYPFPGTGRFSYKGAAQCSMPVLTYFDVDGLAESVRLAFKIGEVPFVDRRITKEEWVKHYKNYSPSGKAPFLEVGGEVLVESVAIMQYAARRAGLMPDTLEEEMKANMAVEWTSNYRNNLVASLPEPPADVEDVGAWRAARAEPLIEQSLGYFEKVFKDWVGSEGYLVGDRLTYADVFVAGGIDVLNKKFLPNDEAYPVLSKIWRNVWEHQRLVDYVRGKTAKATKPVLYRLSNQGIAFPIVWAFALGQIDYEDRVVTHAEWEKMKEMSPSGQLPMLEVGGERYVESQAILMYVAKRAGIVPECDFAYAHAMAVVKQASEIRQVMRASYIQDEAAKKTAIEKANFALLPETISRVEEVISKRQDREGHVVAKRLTFADLWVAQVYHELASAGTRGFKVENLAQRTPRMYTTYKLVMGIPEVQKAQQKCMLSSKPVLVYFDVAGRAEACRLAMHVAGIDFEDRRVTMEQWTSTYKAQSPTGQCPYLEWGNGKKLAESKAILAWATEVAPSLELDTAEQRVIAEYLCFSLTRLDRVIAQYYIAAEDKKAEVKQTIREKEMPVVLSLWEKLWAAESTVNGVSVGDHISWVDCAVVGTFEYLVQMEVLQSDWKKQYPTLAAVYEKVLTYPAVATYRANRSANKN